MSNEFPEVGRVPFWAVDIVHIELALLKVRLEIKSGRNSFDKDYVKNMLEHLLDKKGQVKLVYDRTRTRNSG